MAWRPLVIIGAPRSGTNMLRDVLTRLPGVATWPCDEINAVWRHGNLHHPSDEFPPALARPPVRRYVRRQFDWVARRYAAEVVVEKTCANSLRVPFVDRVVPDARYVFLYRDPLDAVGSAMARWTAPLEIGYVLRKARFVPLTDFPVYALRYVGNRCRRWLARDGRVGLWGPRFDGMEHLLAERPLDEVCALQWQRCVGAATAAFGAMPDERWLGLAYEDFVRDPQTQLARVLALAGIEADAAARRSAVAGISDASIGKGRAALATDTLARLEPLVAGTADTTPVPA